MKNEEVVLASAVSAAAVAQIMSIFVPTVYDVRSGGDVDKEKLLEVTLWASGLAVIIGFASAWATRSPLPLIGAVISAAVLYGIYHWSVNHPFAG